MLIEIDDNGQILNTKNLYDYLAGASPPVIARDFKLCGTPCELSENGYEFCITFETSYFKDDFTNLSRVFMKTWLALEASYKGRVHYFTDMDIKHYHERELGNIYIIKMWFGPDLD
jgi:hypothetical protein